MDFKLVILLFTLIHTILARPQEGVEDVEGTKTDEEDDDYDDVEWDVKCGKHNLDGLKEKVEGAATQQGEWPHACIIYHKNEIVGSASLVAPTVLVSAAHTLEMKKAEDLKIRCGEYDLSSDEEEHEYQERDVRSYTLSPFYTGPKTVIQDIAVIHTTKSFIQAPNVDTICLQKPLLKGEEENFSKLKCSSMGWDSTKNTTMNQVQIDMTDSAECKASILDTEKVPESWNFDDSWICSQDSGIKNVACQGSGGNALVCQENEVSKMKRNVLAGIASFGVGCGEDIVAEVFTKVSDVICFIQFETICKYGSRYLDHYNFADCRDYLNKKIEELKVSPDSRADEFLENAKFLNESCATPALRKNHFQLG